MNLQLLREDIKPRKKAAFLLLIAAFFSVVSLLLAYRDPQSLHHTQLFLTSVMVFSSLTTGSPFISAAAHLRPLEVIEGEKIKNQTKPTT